MTAADRGPSRPPGDWLSDAATHLVLCSHGGAASSLQASTVTGPATLLKSLQGTAVCLAPLCTVSAADLGPSRAPDGWLSEAVTLLVLCSQRGAAYLLSAGTVTV